MIWILGFFSFLSGAVVINAIIMWFNLGPQATFTPHLLGGLIGAIPVYAYFLGSVLVTLVFLGVTSHKLVSELSNEDQLNAINEKVNLLENGQQEQQKAVESVYSKMFLIDESLEHTRRQFSKGLNEQGEAIRQSFEDGNQSQLKMLDSVQARMLALDQSLTDDKEFSKGLSEQGEAIRQSFEDGNQSQIKMLDSVQARMFLLDQSLTDAKREFSKGLNEQGEAVKGVNANLVNRFDSQTYDIKEVVAKQLVGVGNALAQLKQRDKKTAVAVVKQRDEIAEIKSKLEKLEGELVKPKRLLTSQSNVEDVKGIGPGKGAELREIGITNVSELIMADPKALAEKMGSSDKTVEKLQGRAELSTVPGVKEKDIFLLEELDIVNRKSLAEQDPVELSRKINAIFKVNLASGKVTEADKPNFEEIESWVKFTRA